MGIKLEDIKDPSLRATIERQLASQTVPAKTVIVETSHPAKRIRQDPKPLLNKLETQWLEVLQMRYPGRTIYKQALRFRLGNGIWFKPDMAAFMSDGLTVWETKGPHAFRGGFENLKVAAGMYPEVRWVLVWKERGKWQEQEVLP